MLDPGLQRVPRREYHVAVELGARLQVCGLSLSLVGAFLVSIEAIGLDRIRMWRERFLEDPAYVLEARDIRETEKRAIERRMRYFPVLLHGLAAGCCAALGSWLALYVLGRFWWLGILIGGAVGYVSADVVRFGLQLLSRGLLWADENTPGCVGIIGFTMLATGIGLQIAGVVL